MEHFLFFLFVKDSCPAQHNVLDILAQQTKDDQSSPVFWRHPSHHGWTMIVRGKTSHRGWASVGRTDDVVRAAVVVTAVY